MATARTLPPCAGRTWREATSSDAPGTDCARSAADRNPAVGAPRPSAPTERRRRRLLALSVSIPRRCTRFASRAAAENASCCKRPTRDCHRSQTDRCRRRVADGQFFQRGERPPRTKVPFGGSSQDPLKTQTAIEGAPLARIAIVKRRTPPPKRLQELHGFRSSRCRRPRP